MNIRETLLVLGLALALPVTAQAGGPVIVEDDTEVVAESPRSGWLLPVLLLVTVAVIASADGDDDAPASEGPQPCVKTVGGC